MERKDLENMSTADLRTMVRDSFKMSGQKTTKVVYMSKEDCISYLLDGTVPPETAETAETAKAVTVDTSDAAAAIAALKTLLGAQAVDKKAVEEIIAERFGTYKEELASMIAEHLTCRPVEIKNIETGEVKNVGVQHEQFEKVLKAVQCGLHVMLVGEAGSGKTTLAHNVAIALDRPFYLQSVCEQTTKTDLLGYSDVNGNYRISPLVKAFTEGGIFLLDEADAGSSNTFVVINAMLANGIFTRPDGVNMTRHENFIFMAAANTFGKGANRLYVGRNQMDAATLNRFAVIRVDTDEQLELSLSPDKRWTAKVQKMRWAANELREKVIVSQRASIHGARLLAAGFTEMEVAESMIFQGANPEIISRIISKSGVELKTV